MPPTKPAPSSFPPALRDAILAWYDAAGRAIPFRGVTDPYAILVSELMAQQTQVGRAAAYWSAWMTQFPTVEALAAAPVADAVRAWAGLGYNRRAVHLHRAARAIVAVHGGRVPGTIDELEALPGVGPYTARAVAAIAFGVPVGPVDVNVRRVLQRTVAGGDLPLGAPALQVLADAAVPPERPADWAHALMDVGATFCRPRPRCPGCPAASLCTYVAAAEARGTPKVAVAHKSGAAPDGPRRPAHARRPFPETTRWLRGRLLERARLVPDGSWTRYDLPVGSHGALAVREALATLVADGLLEVREDDDRGPEARLPAG